jgi:hypothetical protein
MADLRERQMWSPRGLHENADFIETFASLRSRNVSLYFLLIVKKEGMKNDITKICCY